MSHKALFIEAVQAVTALPAPLRENADKVTSVGEHTFDESYIEFLDAQILLSARGPESLKRLKHLRAAMQPFCGVTLLRGIVPASGKDFHVEIHAPTRTVVHWQEY